MKIFVVMKGNKKSGFKVDKAYNNLIDAMIRENRLLKHNSTYDSKTKVKTNKETGLQTYVIKSTLRYRYVDKDKLAKLKRLTSEVCKL